MACSRLTSEIVKGCTLDLGFGAAPQRTFHLVLVACGDKHQMEGKLGRSPKPQVKGATLDNPACQGAASHLIKRSSSVICVMSVDERLFCAAGLLLASSSQEFLSGLYRPPQWPVEPT